MGHVAEVSANVAWGFELIDAACSSFPELLEGCILFSLDFIVTTVLIAIVAVISIIAVLT